MIFPYIVAKMLFFVHFFGWTHFIISADLMNATYLVELYKSSGAAQSAAPVLLSFVFYSDLKTMT